MRRPDHSSLQRSDSVTVNGCTTVNVNSSTTNENLNGCSITVNGFKNVINVSGPDEKSELNFEEEDETAADNEIKNIVKVVENIKIDIKNQANGFKSDENSNCDTG